MKRICARSGGAHSGGAQSDQNQLSERFICATIWIKSGSKKSARIHLIVFCAFTRLIPQNLLESEKVYF